MIGIFGVFLAFFSAGSFLFKNKTFSENENRYLQELPSFSAETVVSGMFAQEMEDYVEDRLTGREFLIGTKSSLLAALGIREVNGVYLCEDQYYIQKQTNADVDRALYLRNLTSLQKYFTALAEQGIDKSHLQFLPVPTASAILREKLPQNAPYFDEFEVLTAAKEILGADCVVDVTEALRQIDSAFYKTDHHWTTDGAYAAYAAWCHASGRTAAAYSEFDIYTVDGGFRGTLYSKVLSLDAPYDTVRYYVPKEAPKAELWADGRNLTLKYGFLDEAYFTRKDKYAAFFGGNYGELRISCQMGTGKNLLVLKDSYANCFVPFLYGQFDRITMIDLRYFNGNLLEYVREQEITDVLVLYNISTFISDKNIGKVGLI